MNALNFNQHGPTIAGGGFAANVGGPVIFTLGRTTDTVASDWFGAGRLENLCTRFESVAVLRFRPNTDVSSKLMAAAEFAYLRFSNQTLATPLTSSRLHELSARKSAENRALNNEVFVNQSIAHAELIASFRRAEVDAAHKFGLIKAVGKKGPKAIQVAVETADKAAKRRDSYAKKLHVLGVSLKD